MTEQEALERCDRLINGFSVNNSTYDAFKDDEKGYPTFAKMKEFAEECKSALEKQIAKKPNIEGDGYADGHLVYDTWICPNCEKYYEIDYDDYDYCPNCGQKIDKSVFDWGNEDAE